MDYANNIAKNCKEASSLAARLTSASRNQILYALAQIIDKRRKFILRANAVDLQQARNDNLNTALYERLTLNSQRIDAIITSLEQVAMLDDLVGEISEVRTRPSGIKVGKMTVPLGSVFMIYESRPNVTIEAASLIIKSANAGILRGGKEAAKSNAEFAKCINLALKQNNAPPNLIQIVDNPDRNIVNQLLKMRQYIDVVIPRGGTSLVQSIVDNATMPAIMHLSGNCHMYIDNPCDLDMAQKLVLNAKTRRLGVCNALESLLIHQVHASTFLPTIIKQLTDLGIECRVCPQSIQTLKKPSVKKNFPKNLHYKSATEEDYYTEYADAFISICLVKDIDHAITHINHYSSQHTDAIVTTNHQHAMHFLKWVDSSSVIVNASTSFADGFEYGLGAEVGISTDKFHARGPVGLAGLSSKKYIVFGDGQIRD